jgi:hypothetical protein
MITGSWITAASILDSLLLMDTVPLETVLQPYTQGDNKLTEAAF